ncbi:MAG TPA: protein kinase [Pyrinomonadaceae bacterium]|nr:protein kinase [Pyrinomonadaceae bacterium]
MTLASGTQLGRYEIRSKIGEGGMGEVYRARDGKLNRDVAIKILPQAFAGDSDRLARFKREAQVLAALNHPNIASIYGLEESNGSLALAMELVEGPTLADRIAAGPIPLDESLIIARQIGAALEAAHERGIIHRDIKPANIKVNDDDVVKVLDFGLAKVFVDETPDTDLSHSPTLIKGTQAGMILGTAAYMSPEQAKGKVVDKRSDIWAFGCVLFEMITGKQSFSGETLTDILASVVRAEPDWNLLPASTPVASQRLLRRCLTKDPKQRLRDIGEARITIENFQSGRPEEITTTLNRPPPLRKNLLWAGAIALAFILGGLGMWLQRPVSSEMPLRKTELQIPGLELSFIYYGYSISPNGKSIAYVSNHRLWIRDLDRLDPREVPNTENASHPFWSPDSAYVGYVIGKKMWKVSSVGAGTTAITDLPDLFSGAGAASWRADGVIIFTTGDSGLMQVPAQGGDPSALLNVGADEADFHDASLLPDGRGVLFAVHRAVQGVDTIALFDGKSRKNLLQLDGQRIDHPVYSPTGHILFERRMTNAGIWALPFSLSRLEVTGEPFLVAPGAGAPKVADDGTLVFGFGEVSVPTRLVWMDRTGKIVNNIQPDPLPFQLPSLRLSPDEKQLVQATRESGKTDYWIVNLARGTRTRLTFDNSARGWFCGWTPDGQRVMYASGDTPPLYKIRLKAADGSGEAREFLSGLDASFSPDGKFVVYSAPERQQSQQDWDLWYIGTEPGAKPLPFLVTPKDQRYADFSPDGNYVAYASNESGRYEVYVKPFPNGEGKSRVSIDGGSLPRWSRRGDELFFVWGNDIMAVHVQTKPSLVLGQPQKLFSRRPVAADRAEGLYDSYDVSADGQRFVMLQSDEQTTTSQKLTIIQNWFAEFKDRQK